MPLPLDHRPKGALFRSRLLGRRSSAGVVMVEYAFLLAFFAVPVAVATSAFGLGIIRHYSHVRNDMLHEFP
jgi:Flp pilus assembly pilin Flp